MSPKIFTILLNPTIDQICIINNFSLGRTYKITDMQRFPVGKAISVALTLNTLQIPVYIIALIGDNEIKEYSQFLRQNNLEHTLIPVEGTTRSNLTLIDPLTNESTHLRFPGFNITLHHLDQLHIELENRIQKDDYVVFSGSFPQGCPEEYCFTPSEIIRRKGAHFILDTSGTPLVNMLLYHPFLIKANLEEMGTILGIKLITDQEFERNPSDDDLYNLLDQCVELTNYPSFVNILTLAKYGALAFTREHAYYAILPLEYAPYTVGCGDAFLAGFLAGIYHHMDIQECLILATACGAANTQSPGAGIISKSIVDVYRSKVQFRQLK